jgi:hypothetical protein
MEDRLAGRSGLRRIAHSRDAPSVYESQSRYQAVKTWLEARE